MNTARDGGFPRGGSLVGDLVPTGLRWYRRSSGHGAGYAATVALGALLSACGHTQTGKIGLMSIGNLEGRAIPAEGQGVSVSRSDCSKIGGDPYHLSVAVREALGTQYDTLVDAEVTTTTGAFVFSNCVKVKGNAIRSADLEQPEGGQ